MFRMSPFFSVFGPVDRNADRFWKAAIAQRRRGRAVLDDEGVAQRIQFLGAHAGHNMGADHVEAFRRQPPGPAHAFEIRAVMQADAFGRASFTAGAHCAITSTPAARARAKAAA
jgi:hypothetical protein